jgi:hypothetical protein
MMRRIQGATANPVNFKLSHYQRPRLYSEVLTDHLRRHRQMALVAAPQDEANESALVDHCAG